MGSEVHRRFTRRKSAKEIPYLSEMPARESVRDTLCELVRQYTPEQRFSTNALDELSQVYPPHFCFLSCHSATATDDS